MTKFYLKTLGCKVNQYDGAKLASFLKTFGWQQTTEAPDLILVNTCAVTSKAIVKNRHLVNQLRREFQGAKIALLGCWPRTYQADAKKLAVDFLISNKEPLAIAQNLIALMNESGPFCAPTLLSATDRARYFIKIQDGCRQFCSYCLIPYARGKLSSRPQAEVVAEVAMAIKAGYGEIVLSGIHLGLYGQESEAGNLVKLLKVLLKLKGEFRLRLSSIEITELSDELINLIKAESRLCRHLHISLQSGCDKILKLMNRPYDTAYFAKRVTKLRQAVPDIALSTDIIVGFPGETEADFKATLNFAKSMAFSKIHVFSFSAHPQTPAYTMPEQVSLSIIKARSKKLRQLSDGLTADFVKNFKGRDLEVAVIGRRQGKLIGKSQYYFDVEFDESNIIKQSTTGKLIGKLVKISQKS